MKKKSCPECGCKTFKIGKNEGGVVTLICSRCKRTYLWSHASDLTHMDGTKIK